MLSIPLLIYQQYFFQDSAPLKGGRGHASVVIKCKLCGRENSIGKNLVICLFCCFILVPFTLPLKHIIVFH